ncbi:ubiquinol-cytochrome c reductase iron-sulfur subunit [Nostoc sp. LEGE 06077]|uniref:QcrA and Rieske domain-containing protein n=1 Tax=Nostoc sp. LEGE 06077 TaxID=915325 RepID=UPI00188280B6|nr:ubiquinol-cytochrome c reductase iron-sulfur subunit [Nostoc sp. LEGE 06077]MBE9210560.1 ubiquinol-cytochrome c reductase iron-sulfur subunit [Nostoc sp. LEGE 06077]
MKRRDFINWVGLGLIATNLPVAIAACNSEKSTSTSATSGDWQKVGTTKDLDQKGQLLVKGSPVGDVLLVGTSQAGNLIAVDPTCTHKGCTVDWKADAKKFACPCHRAEYGTDGQVQKGPAEKPLKTYTAKIEGDAILVKG